MLALFHLEWTKSGSIYMILMVVLLYLVLDQFYTNSWLMSDPMWSTLANLKVSTAARLADGALVVVDCVEGVEAQTRTVLRQAQQMVPDAGKVSETDVIGQINAWRDTSILDLIRLSKVQGLLRFDKDVKVMLGESGMHLNRLMIVYYLTTMCDATMKSSRDYQIIWYTVIDDCSSCMAPPL